MKNKIEEIRLGGGSKEKSRRCPFHERLYTPIRRGVVMNDRRNSDGTLLMEI